MCILHMLFKVSKSRGWCIGLYYMHCHWSRETGKKKQNNGSKDIPKSSLCSQNELLEKQLGMKLCIELLN